MTVKHELICKHTTQTITNRDEKTARKFKKNQQTVKIILLHDVFMLSLSCLEEQHTVTRVLCIFNVIHCSQCV